MIQTLLVMKMGERYPFYSQGTTNQIKQVGRLVRQTIFTKENTHQDILSKAIFLKNLRNKYLVRVESVQEQQHYIFIYYEYIQCQDWTFASKSSQLFQDIFQQLQKFVIYLKNIGLKAELLKNQIGISPAGKLKFFMGLNFQYDVPEDQIELDSYYQSQLNSILEGTSCYKYNNTTDCSNSVYENDINNYKQRKVSFTTLPSHNHRLRNLDRKLSGIKNTVRKIGQNTKNEQKAPSLIKEYNNIKHNSVNHQNINNYSQNHNRYLGRKFSDNNLKFNFQSNKRLQEKESDIKSERITPIKTKLLKMNNNINNMQQFEPDSPHQTSRAQQYRNNQYMRLLNSNKEYLQDFCSVLEDKKEMTKAKSSTNLLNLQYNKPKKLQKSIQLKQKTNKVIENSLKAITKFRRNTCKQ